ncbi:MAG: helix-turn-helix domain-containing protein [Collimonas pratensis]|uniref:helix-turn-helix domain-containing protein n=1 Tax=Collimonas pratensis TaxID=279113 RepID=UPI003C70BD25
MDNENITSALQVPPLSETTRHCAAYPKSTSAPPVLANYRNAHAPAIVHSHFTVEREPQQRQLLAWRDRVGHIIDVLPSLHQVENPFHASIDRYSVGKLAFTDCRSDALLLERSVARISTDSIRDYVFQVFLEGGVESDAGTYAQRRSSPSVARMIALDMNQPVRMQRHACRVLTLSAPRSLVEMNFPDAEAIHGRVIHDITPLTRLLIEHIASLNQDLAVISAGEADSALHASIHLLVAAFGKQAGLTGNARAAARAAISGQVRRYIQANLHQAELSPESLLNTLQLPRGTLYRLFAHEGGLGTYIRNRRLRAAADELVRYPDLAVVDIAYGLGFKSASDFTRAFRRAYDMAPQDLRAQAFELRRTRSK